MRLRGILAGSLALIALQVATSSDRAAGRVGDMLSGIADLVRLVLDPSVPGIPDLGGSGSTEQSSYPATSIGLDDDEDAPPARLPKVLPV